MRYLCLRTPVTYVPGLNTGRERGSGGEGLALERTLAIAADICRGLSFVHARGMVHRDLKPANVFLDGAGAAKIGDFGLALALDRSRLTQHGLMLGTVSYMPPEQALGGESTPQADLYSLGCMLYEMVTGRPPFVGDDPTAVISQHINQPPVAPSYLTECCPPALEELLIALLAKAPADRPKDAAAVLAALERIDPTQRSATHSDSNALERLARGVFVGREKELGRLRKAFDEAFAGHGGLVMLVGEPGIGKTRTTAELETYAKMRGATVLWGRTHESSGAPPYWPWLQVGNQFVASYPEQAGRLNLAPETLGELGRLFPFLKSQPNYVEPRETYSPESAQFRLFDAYATMLKAIAGQAGPALPPGRGTDSRGDPPPLPRSRERGSGGEGTLVIALDDLHWADKSTLQLLEHVARELGRSRILIVANYRDTDITRQSALSETLATLNREPGFERVVLRGLSREEVAAYIKAKANVEPRREVLDRIYEETEGNAFFLSEVVNLMAEEGTLAKDSVSDIAIPDGVKEALGRRLNRLSPETNELLQVATVIGREFTYDTLTLLGSRAPLGASTSATTPGGAWDEDTLLRLLEEAIDARVIEELPQPGRYRFTHAQMQETLLAELSTTRRVRLHGQVGEALEKRYGDRAEENAARLATHFVEAAALSERFAEKARKYGLAAAGLAEVRAAWAEAVRWYESATSGQDPDPAVLVRLARALNFSQPFSSASDRVQRQAVDIYRGRGDRTGIAVAMTTIGLTRSDPSGNIPLLREALEVDDELDVRTRIVLRQQLAQLLGTFSASSGDEIRRLEEETFRLADAVEVVGGGAIRLGLEAAWAFRAGDPSRGVELSLKAARDFGALGFIDESQWQFLGAAGAALLAGKIGSATDYSREAWEAAIASGHGLGQNLQSLYLSAALLLRWMPEDLLAVERQRHAAPAATFAIYGPYEPAYALATYSELVGDRQNGYELLSALQRGTDWDKANDQRRVQYFARATVGKHPWVRPVDAAAEFEEWKQEWRNSSNYPDFHRLEAFSLASLFLSHLGENEFWASVWADARRWKNRCAPYSGLSLDPARGTLALRLGFVNEAEQCFRDGLEWAEREDCPVELGRNLQGLAAVAERRGDIPGALALLDRAAAQYQPRGVKLFLDQVIADKVRLQGIGDTHNSMVAISESVAASPPDLSLHAAPDGTVALLFSDIEGSTPLNNQLGDAKWLEVLHAHNAILDSAIAAHGGRTVKTMGDGYMVAFPSPAAAVACALAVQGEFSVRSSEFSVGDAGSTVRVRIGIHVGAMVRDAGDFFGREVNYAARVASAALGGEIVVSEAARERLGADVALDAGREVELKGFGGLHRVYAVTG